MEYELYLVEGEQLIKIEPPHCKKCHHSWWFIKFNWEEGKPQDPVWCPCCISAKFSEGFEPGNGPQPGEEGVVLAYCPKCKINFLSRETWLAKQDKIRKKEKNPNLPYRVQENDSEPLEQEKIAS